MKMKDENNKVQQGQSGNDRGNYKSPFKYIALGIVLLFILSIALALIF